MLNRRRALMAAQKSTVLFDWKPSDGASPLIFTSGTNYNISSTRLRVFCKSSWGLSGIYPASSIPYGNKYKLTVSYSGYSGSDEHLYLTTRNDNYLNNRAMLNVKGKQLSLFGTDTHKETVNPVPSSGIISLIVNKVNNTFIAVFNGVEYGPFSLSTATHTSLNLIGIEGSSTSYYFDIDRIKIENLS